MGKALVLAVALFLLAAPIAKSAPHAGELRPGAEETVLRLHDLPPGYLIAEESGCDRFDPSGLRVLRAYDKWIAEARAVGCEFGYERRFLVPGTESAPLLVMGETINTPSAKSAAKGYRILFRLIPRLTEWQPGGTISLGPAGPTATLFHFKEAFEVGSRPVSVLLWRHGPLLAAIEAGGLSQPEIDSAALYYAQVQQRRIEAPTPYTDAERDDTEVELDSPDLKVPVYWLGRTFGPTNSSSSAELLEARVIEKRGLPGSKLVLQYDGLKLETWTRQGWKRFQRSLLGKLNHPRCTTTIAFEWAQGHAQISAGYRRRTFEDGCPSYPPTRYWAVAHISGVVVGVNQTVCRCLSPGYKPFSTSLAGMKAVLRGLTLRPKPVYAGAS